MKNLKNMFELFDEFNDFMRVPMGLGNELVISCDAGIEFIGNLFYPNPKKFGCYLLHQLLG